MKIESIYRVESSAPDRWKVIGDGTPPTYHSTEEDAIATARQWAMINEPSLIIIQKADGSVEEEHMMRMDSFPHSPDMSKSNGTAETPTSDRTSHIQKRMDGEGRIRRDGYDGRRGHSA